jgi:uncharacterized membrane protein YciS (DUF1049 family)
MSDSKQSFAHHAKMVPMYHYWAFGMLFVPTLYFAFMAVTDFSLNRLMVVIFAGGIILAAFFARLFPLGVQDRVIRLEERLRMERVLPDELRNRANEVSTDLLVGLRFAPDEELTELTRQVLDGGLSDRKAVKQAIKNWRADHQRI